eukprot:jgi/Pico_ML_1/52764/g3427.t1
MVAASKMRGVQSKMQQARGFPLPFVKLLGDLPGIDVNRNLFLTVSTDRGLCGGINSTLSKYTRTLLNLTRDGEEKKLMIAIIGLEKHVDANGMLDMYELEGPDRGELLQDLAEFQLVASVFSSLLDNQTSEMGARMMAMDSSSRNAADMLGKLTLSYNRSRQAGITTELIEIISGAAALDEAK